MHDVKKGIKNNKKQQEENVGKFQVIELIQKEIVKNANAVRKEPWKKTRLGYINEGLERAITIIEKAGK